MGGVGAAAAQKRVTGRAADALLDVGLVENHPLPRQGVQPRGDEPLAAVGEAELVAQVVWSGRQSEGGVGGREGDQRGVVSPTTM